MRDGISEPPGPIRRKLSAGRNVRSAGTGAEERCPLPVREVLGQRVQSAAVLVSLGSHNRDPFRPLRRSAGGAGLLEAYKRTAPPKGRSREKAGCDRSVVKSSARGCLRASPVRRPADPRAIPPVPTWRPGERLHVPGSCHELFSLPLYRAEVTLPATCLSGWS